MKKILGYVLRASFLFVYALSFVFPTQSVNALTGVTVTSITPYVTLDSNGSCTDGPRAMYMQAKVTNTSGGTLNNLVATVNFTTTTPGGSYTGSWALDTGQSTTFYIGTLANNATYNVFFYITYPCESVGGQPAAISKNYSIVVSNGVAPDITQNLTVTTRYEISANAGGQLYSFDIAPGASLGQIIKMTTTYDYGNVGSGNDLGLQPAGNISFDSSCYQLIASDITNVTGVSGITTSDDNVLYKTGVSSGGGTNRITVDYYFKVVCDSGTSTTLSPWADMVSGTQQKYTGNYTDPFTTCDNTPCDTSAPGPTNPLTITKSASPTNLPSGGSTTYTITVSNSSAYDSQIDKILDVLPGGVTYGGLVNGVSCPGTNEVTSSNSSSLPTGGASGTIQFIANSVSTASFPPSGGYLVPAGGSINLCYTVTIPNTVGSYINSATAQSGTVTIGPATSTVTVGTPPTIAKAFNLSTIQSGGTSTITFTLTNTNASALTGASFTDTLANMSISGAQTAGGTCVGVSGNNFTDGQTALTLSGLTIPASGSCTVTIVVTSTNVGVNPNTTSGVTTTQITTAGAVSNTANLTVLAPPSITKDFAAANLASGGTTTLTVTLGNTNLVAITLTSALTDTMPTGMTITNPGTPGGTCTGVSATANDFTVANGTSIPAGGCTVVFTVTSSTAGAATNTIAAGDLQTNAGNNGSPATDTVNVYVPPTVTKSFSPASIVVGGSSTMTIVVTNPAGNPGNLTGVSVGDNYTGTLVNNAAGSVSCDTGSSATLTGGVNGGTSVGFNNGTLEPGDSCTITQSVTATSTNNNTTTAPAATGPVALSGTAASDTLTVTALSAPSISKSFSPNPINVGGVSTLTFTITNPNAGTALTGVAFTDTFPTDMEVAATPNANTTGCGSPTFAPSAGNTSLTFSGGTIAAAGTCSVTVDVTATTGGSKVNTTSNVSSTNGGTGNTGTDTLVVDVPVNLQVTKDDGVTSFIAGGTLTYTIRVWNTGPNNVTGATLSDTRPTDISSWSWTCTATGAGSSCGTPSNGVADILVTGINLPADPGGSTNFLTYTVTAAVSSTPVGFSLTNTVTVTEPAGTLDTDPTNNDASDTNGQIFDPPSSFKTFTAIGGIPVLEFRMVWVNNGNATAIDVQVTDTIPAGTTYVPGSVTCTPTNAVVVVPPSSTAAAATAPLNTNPLQVTPSTSCGFDSVSNTIQWQGTIAPDPGVVNDANAEANASHEIVITFQVTVDAGINSVSNVGTSRTDADNNGDFTSQADILGTTIVNSNLVTWNRDPGAVAGGGGGRRITNLTLPGTLPDTGFTPNKVTVLPEQPEELAYRATEVWLEVPRLGLKMPIVGVPLYEEDWDISWLWQEAGWLEGTAFPTWQGNSVLTSHVTLPNGEAGPFALLGKLKWGDRILVHAYGTVYIYQVRQNRTVSPTDTSVLQHEDDAWLTLLTCKTYIESTDTYANRIAVRAVLIGTMEEKTSGSNSNIR